MNGWVQKLPNWWPVGAGVVVLILALGETRWEIQRHVGKEAEEEKKAETLQWQGIADLNKQVTTLEEWRDGISDRLSDATFQDWVSDRARKDAMLLRITEDIESLEARVGRLEQNP